MVNKGLLYGIIGFLLGGLVVSSAAMFLDEPTAKTTTATVTHNAQTTAALKNLQDDAFDKAFMAEMLLHHQGAVDMAALAETRAKHDEIKQLAREITVAQTTEIDTMRAWQVQWGYAAETETDAEAHQTH
jgi:uncharacterized protein (DUF305 family)